MIRKHVGEKPHSCKQYNYMSTTFSDALQIHMMTHKQWREALQVTSVIALTHKHISCRNTRWHILTRRHKNITIPSLACERACRACLSLFLGGLSENWNIVQKHCTFCSTMRCFSDVLKQTLPPDVFGDVLEKVKHLTMLVAQHYPRLPPYPRNGKSFCHKNP